MLECSAPPPLEAAFNIYGRPGVFIFDGYTSNNLESKNCSVDEREVEPCNFPLTLTTYEFGPGWHTLHIMWTDVCGQMAQTSEDFYFSYSEEIFSKNAQPIPKMMHQLLQ